MKSIVILGGSYAGVSTAHRLLQQASKIQPFKVTIISPNTHFYWNLASPRGFLPGQLTDDELFQPIAAGFEKYSADRFEFVLGLAESVDVDTKTVRISSGKVLNYDYLVLATGSRPNGNMPFKGLGSTQATKDALYQTQACIQKATTIVVAGAGVTGVEVAGELAFEYGRQKKIVLVSCGPLHTVPSLQEFAIECN
jgi:NADH dehydrogenase FAD-containing subunit